MSSPPPVEQHDVFAAIAERRQAASRHTLIAPQPPEMTGPTIVLEGLDPAAVFTPGEKLDTPEKLCEELARQRERYVPFLRQLAPPLPETRAIIPIDTFAWRLPTEQELADFASILRGDGAWETVAIPHYGGPLGRAVACYRTTVTLDMAMLAPGVLFVCFDGVDYRAQVYFNDRLVGTHEGFFAPFECDCTAVARAGKNTLLVLVENDAICMGNDSWGDDGHLYEGDKIYAATGVGYDDPEIGWHHCPPGMGIYQPVRLEARAPVHVHDLFVRPLSLDGAVEVWIEITNTRRLRQPVCLSLSIYGQNFSATAVEDLRIEQPALGPGVNYLRIPLTLTEPHIWEPETPWLYQLHVRVLDDAGETLDGAACQFGLRTFRMEEAHEPKGRLFLNEREIRLRGANTMGFEQRDVITADWAQLIDDILLAKICHLNFWRLTQRPVQRAVYDYCDRLGLLTQTDLPLFGVLRRNQFCETVRQAEEMERLVRAHPCNIMVSYINEPFPNAMGKAHRHLSREELERFFLAADQAVWQANPDRVIKAVDGDYDPPAPGLPDNHCYCGWYNGHGVDLGRLHRGYWQLVKPGWRYGCGEFGAEGLDPVALMRRHYPPAWLPHTPEEEARWTPDQILKAQTGRFHYLWFDTQHTVEDWVAAGQRHQGAMTRLMTEAFRRDDQLISCAIHLFIDAFPAGWMKAIMDVERMPKPAYFAYRDALTPLMVNLRSDRWGYWVTEAISLEAWACNDLDTAPDGAELLAALEIDGQVIAAQRLPAQLPVSGSAFQGWLRFPAPAVAARTPARARLALRLPDGSMLHDTTLEITLFPPAPVTSGRAIRVVGAQSGPAAQLAGELGLTPQFTGPYAPEMPILIDDADAFLREQAAILAAVEHGATAVFLALPAGAYRLGPHQVTVTPCGMGARHFVSRATGHPLTADFLPEDFRLWHDPVAECITPLLDTTVDAPGWTTILASGNGGWESEWAPANAVMETAHGRGMLRVCALSLAQRTRTNPVACLFAERLLKGLRG